MFEKKRTVDLSPWDLGPVTLKRLTAGEVEEYTNESTRKFLRSTKGRTMEVETEMGTAVLLYIKACTVEAPWPNTLDELRKLDGTLMDYLYAQAQEVNESPLERMTSSA